MASKKTAAVVETSAAKVAKLDAAINAVMAAMPQYGNRMSYADMKAVLGWPAGYYNITKLARELETRGLAKPGKRVDDKLTHWELPAGSAKAPRKGKGTKAAKAPRKAACAS